MMMSIHGDEVVAAAAPAPMQQQPKQTATTWSPMTRDIVGGVFAGAVNVTSGYGFDTVKVRMQASGGSLGMTQAFKHIYATEGTAGFFRGLSSPLIGGAAEAGVNYAVYSRVLEFFKPQQQQQYLSATAAAVQQQQQQQCLPPLSAVPVAGAVAGVALSGILSPVELVKCRMQVGQHTSPIGCVRHLLATEGLRGVTRGLGATLAREVPGNAIFFGVYEGLRRTWPGARGGGHGSGASSSSAGSSSLWETAKDASGAVLCGGLAGMAMWGVVLPLDVAKTRIQTAAPGSSWDMGLVAQLKHMARDGGRRALWAGLGPTMVRAFPANACQWLAWEFAMQHMLPPAHAEEAAVVPAAVCAASL